MNTRFLSTLATLVVILSCALDVHAQLPVRTRTLQLLGATSGTMTQLASSTTTSYSVTWPDANATWPVPAGTTQYFLRADAGTAGPNGNSNLSWYPVNGQLVDNGGTTPANRYVAYWNDANTLTGEIGFQWNDGTNTLTMGQSGDLAEVVFTNGTLGITLQTEDPTVNQSYTLSAISGATNLFIPAATNEPTAAGQILESNAAGGAATWVANPLAGFRSGLVNPPDNGFIAYITLPVAPDDNDVIVISSYDLSGSPSGNILSVTAIPAAAPAPANSILVTSSGPFLASERISYMFIPVP